MSSSSCTSAPIAAATVSADETITCSSSPPMLIRMAHQTTPRVCVPNAQARRIGLGTDLRAFDFDPNGSVTGRMGSAGNRMCRRPGGAKIVNQDALRC